MSATIAPAPLAIQPIEPDESVLRRAWRRLVGEPGRVFGIDLARGLAVLGMFAAHFAGAPDLVWNDPTTWIGVVHGRSSILFATLGGVSLAFMTGGRAPYIGRKATDARLRIVVRSAALFVLGGLLAAVGSNIAVILEYYAVLFLIGLIFARWPVRRLVIAAAVAAPVGVAAVCFGRALLGVLQSAGAASDVNGIVTFAITGMYPALGWTPFVLAGLAIGRLDLSAVRTAVRLLVVGALLAAFGYGAGAAGEAAGLDPYSVTALDSDNSGSAVDLMAVNPNGSASFVGEGDGAGSMASFDAMGPMGGTPVDVPPASDLRCEDTGGSVSCVDAATYEDMLSWSQDWDDDGSGFDSAIWPTGSDIVASLLSTSPHSNGLPEIVGSGGFAIMVIGLSLLAARVLRRVLFPLAAVGSMALTVYSLHILLYTAVTLWMPKWFENAGEIYGLLVLGALLFATAWRAFLGRGPLERGMRWLTYRATRVPTTPFAGNAEAPEVTPPPASPAS